MNNIFENAYFGKAYKTKDNRKAIFYNHHNSYAREKARYVTMILENQEAIYRWYYDGTAADHKEHLDIISEWQEEISEEELDRLAEETFPYDDENDDAFSAYLFRHTIRNAFKTGFSKALEYLSNNKR